MRNTRGCLRTLWWTVEDMDRQGGELHVVLLVAIAVQRGS